MINADENIIELKKYFKKLEQALEDEVVFKFGNKRFVKKNRIDDILCCIEAKYPTEIKKLYRKIPNEIKGYNAFVKLNKTIRKSSFLNNTLYVIKYNETLNSVQFVSEMINSDFKYLNNN